MVETPARSPGSEGDTVGLYGISVVAELTDTGVQNIRAYERRGLLLPARTDGGTRRYSNADLDRLRRIRDLLEGGLNLAGVVLVMQLQDENANLRSELHREQAGPPAP